MTTRSPGVPGGVRRPAVLVSGFVVLAVVVGLAIGLRGAPAGTSTATATPNPTTSIAGVAGPVASAPLGDLPLVTVAPTAAPSQARASAASPSAAPSVVQGVPANRIRIARLGIDLAIIEGDGLDAPIGKAAHYPGSAWPGGDSNIYIYGHARIGMFINLWQVKVGDVVELDLVDGKSRRYVVTEVLPKVPFDAVQYLQPTSTEQLTLQTSTSYYATAPRFVVIAAPQT